MQIQTQTLPDPVPVTGCLCLWPVPAHRICRFKLVLIGSSFAIAALVHELGVHWCFSA